MKLSKIQSSANWVSGNKIYPLGLIFALLCAVIFGLGLREDSKNPWVKINGGEFTMGDDFCRIEQANSDWCVDETPHLVRIDSYSIHRYEVNNDEYYECFKDGACSPNDLHEFRPKDFTGGKKPAVFVSWKQASNYCDWVGGRLPTEAEWEFAANTKILGGAHFGQKYDQGATIPVGELEFNSRGLFDMLGNVYEWTRDWYGPYKKEKNQVNPEGPKNGKDKVVRGGSWNSPAHFIRATDRVSRLPEYRYSDVGFRCVKYPSQ